jgi:asparagine synthase (glutamine-hydrolysing)
MVIVYAGHDRHGHMVVGTHPDVVAAVCESDQDWDLTSMAEFLMCGRVSAPQTYYSGVKAMPSGSIFTVDVNLHPAVVESQLKYFDFSYSPDAAADEAELAEELAVAVKRSVRLRALPRLGRTAIALSGGMDSRTILSAVPNLENVITFCCLDSPNAETKVAELIARQVGVEFVPLIRTPEFYAENAEMGVEISGGMGSIANNHFLGFRPWFREAGIGNLLTGCYCDYLLKGLVLDTARSRFSGRDTLAPFRHQHYFKYFPLRTQHAKDAVARQEAMFPHTLTKDQSDSGRTEIEKLRTFPLAYEGDNMQRVIPQRVLPWFLPIVDPGILRVYRKLTPSAKLNSCVFRMMMHHVCDSAVLRIPNANTGVSENASMARQAWARFRRAANRTFGDPSARQNVSSWPNWEFYAHDSRHLPRLWSHGGSRADEVLCTLAGTHWIRRDIGEYTASDVYLFIRLLTLKIWLNYRLGHGRVFPA